MPVVDFSPAGQRPQWLATEHVAAPWLADWVQRHGMLPELALRALAVGLGEALRAVHRAGQHAHLAWVNGTSETAVRSRNLRRPVRTPSVGTVAAKQAASTARASSIGRLTPRVTARRHRHRRGTGTLVPEGVVRVEERSPISP